jgi:hypothetical protein
MSNGINRRMAPARRREKQRRSKENAEYRAGLYRQKATASTSQKRAEIQFHIDQISKRGA